MNNILYPTFVSIPEILTSKTAIIIYVLTILLSIVVLMIAFIVKAANANREYTIVGNIAAPPKEDSPEEKEEKGERFCMLSEIERKKHTYGKASYEKNVTLERFCNEFRDYAASRLKLYYDIEDIRRFIAGDRKSVV